MDRRISVGLFAVAMWGLALLPSDAMQRLKRIACNNVPGTEGSSRNSGRAPTS
jgi:hypothetical protein